ncbi:MAG: prephenate dehydrogenase/arogenate dehydrogenase family protein [Candidatus Alcyoniella australis]|nr:prephenate dehydrogenase/arogenate dehydrogenase family protein [Candidatus Alcyoniella australis]
MRVAVIGCGLIGGSFALALERLRPDVNLLCIDLPQRLPALRAAIPNSDALALDQATDQLRECALVLLASPVERIIELIPRLAPLLGPGAILTDVGSTKTQVMAVAREARGEGTHFIGGHPMAGAESSGIESADPLLFNGRAWLLCPAGDTPPDALLTLIDLVESIGAKPITIEAEEHDRILAVISHAPQLLSLALMSAAIEVDRAHELLQMVAGPGFKELTRLAASDYAVWRGILESNRAPVIEALSLIEARLADVRRAFERDELDGLWAEARQRRTQMGLDSVPGGRKPDIRRLIDHCDEQLLKALADRMRAARRIGEIKAAGNEPVRDEQRERELMHKRLESAAKLDLPVELVQRLFALVLEQSRHVQDQIVARKQPNE